MQNTIYQFHKLAAALNVSTLQLIAHGFYTLNLVWLLDEKNIWLCLMIRGGDHVLFIWFLCIFEWQTFVWTKGHFPFPFLYCYFIEILSQLLCMARGFIDMYIMVSSASSGMVDLRPTGTSFIEYEIVWFIRTKLNRVD